MRRKKICIVTGTRADYGLFYPLLKEIKGVKDFQIQIIATGMHLSPEFGLTYKEIEKDGFRIDDKVEMLLSSDSEAGIAKSTGLGIIGLADSIGRLRPDIIVLLGDRFETFSAATAATIAKIPIAHLHGGESTEGAIDEAMRHSITKMSHIHFTSTEEYRRRVIQLGENPKRVFNVGALGLDNIKNTRLLTKKELEKRLGFEFKKRNILVTYHPVTLERNTAGKQFGELLRAVDGLKDTGVIFTKPNADTYGRVIIGMMDRYAERHSDKAAAYTSLGRLLYLSAVKHADAVVGNSSSGIIEAPSLGVPTVNIGERQRGRVRAESVMDCKPEAEAIALAIKKAFSGGMRELAARMKNPYGGGTTAKKIAGILRRVKLGEKLIMKRFYNIKN
ncbi:MAG: UDP-N-acetylglucosamine 2-epimerase [Thermodesulfovibrionales bacterium]|nr:UDP-N-acetylglucosamine 2-epimerase [Thermodesulfovibrionales bacterium]